LSLPKQHREHGGSQSIAIQHIKICEALGLSVFVAKKDFSEWTQSRIIWFGKVLTSYSLIA